jgi:hypothetical protein
MSKINRREFLKRISKSSLATIWMVKAGGNAFIEADRIDKGNGHAEVTVEEREEKEYWDSPYFVSNAVKFCTKINCADTCVDWNRCRLRDNWLGT